VSAIFGVRGELPWSLVGAYIPAQVLGGVLGTLLAHVMFDLPLLQLSGTARTRVAVGL
jgi:glycerol uptake facilitator-like aquaporin